MEPPTLTPANLALLPAESRWNLLLQVEDITTLGNWCRTVSWIAAICQKEEFWKQKYQKDYGVAAPFEGDTWRKRYKRLRLSESYSPISNGVTFYAVIDVKGILSTAGMNTWGQLGNATLLNSSLPKPLPFKFKVISVSCDVLYAGAITEDGRVYLWGNLTYFSQEGRRRIVRFPQEQTLPDKALKISCGGGNQGGEVSTVFAVILDDQSVYFSGRFTETGENISKRLAIRVRDVYTGHDFVAMISMDYKLYYWGNLPYDPHEYEETPFYHYQTIEDIRPYLLTLPEPIKQAAFGDLYQIFLSRTGQIYVMGSNEEGQLGKPPPLEEGKMFGLTKLALPFPISFISGDIRSVAAIGENGRLLVWGGRTIINPKPGIRTPPTEVSIGVSVNYVAIAGSFVAVTQDGVVNVSDFFSPIHPGF